MRGIRKFPVLLLGISLLALIGVSLLWAQEAAPPPAPPGPPAPATAPAPAAPAPYRRDVIGDYEVRIPPRTQPTSNQVKFKFENPTIDSVLNYLAEVGGYIVIKEVQVPGRISAISPQPLNPQETIAFLNHALETQDMSSVEQGRTLIITTIDKAKKGSPVTYGENPELVPDNDSFVTWVVPVQHVDATKLKQELTPLIATEADTTADASSNTFIITDRSSRVKRVVDMIAHLDANDTSVAEIKLIHLKYADATSAAKLINSIFAPEEQTQSGGAGGNAGGRAGRGGGGGGGGQGGGGGGGPGAFFRNMIAGAAGNTQDKTGPNTRINAVADDRTNTVVISGTHEGVAKAYDLLISLDNNPSAEQTFFIYSLKNASSDKLAAVLNQLFGNTSGTGTSTTSTQRQTSSLTGGSSSSFGGSGGVGGGSSGGSLGLGGTTGGGTGIGARPGTTTGGGVGTTGARAGSQAVVNPLAGQVFVVSNPDTNSLLVTTATKYVEQVKQIIHQEDRPVAQVLIKVLIAEVTHERVDDLGADYSILNVRPSGNGTQIIQNLGNAAANTANGGFAAILTEANITATLHLLSTHNKLDVLSRPYILTSDNQEATITIGNEVPFITNTRETDTGQTINTIQYQDIGIILDVTPHINQDGLVKLDVTPEISEQTGNGVSIAQGVTAPIFSKRSATSEVSIADGQTIVIGGLMQDQKTTTITKVPILGDLPGVGPAFTRYQNDVTKTELLIFLTPHVALAPDSLKPMTADELRGTKLTPNAVAPGEFQDHMRGMQRGDSGLRPTGQSEIFVPTSQPTTLPNVISGSLPLPRHDQTTGGEPAEPGGQPATPPVLPGGTGQ